VYALAAASSTQAQVGLDTDAIPTITTVRENEFRSRWADYQVDRPPSTASDTTDNDQSGGLLSAFGRTFNDYFRTGPLQLRADLSLGWEFTNEKILRLENPHGSENSAFVGPAIAAFYNVESGPVTISARYSIGYIYYLDQSYLAADHNGGILSQTAGLDLSYAGSRATLRSSTSGSEGDGTDIESGAFRNRVSGGELVDTSYLVTDFTQVGASAGISDASYSGGGVAATSDFTATGTLFGDYVITGKSRLRLELGAGDEQQDAGAGNSTDRTYEQALLKVNYVPSDKLTLDVGAGVGVQQASGAYVADVGTHPVYTINARYVPTEKTSATLHFGYEGADLKPDFSLQVQWQPRPNTTVGFSAYQNNNFSTYVLAQNVTTRGVLATIQQKLYEKVELDLAGGGEETVGYAGNTSTTVTPNATAPYYFGSIALLWQFNQSFALQSYYRGYSGQVGATNTGLGLQSRASISLRLTF
jgi:hypothetical protein